jgi:hypothetical protein
VNRRATNHAGGTIDSMSALRNQRLEQLLGGRIDSSLTYAQVSGLIGHAIEAPDLDFKRDLYGGADRDRKAMCGDVAGLANANGGILIIGLDEDPQGRAANATGVDISDAQRQRIRQTVRGNVQPNPTFDVIPVEDSTRPGTGFMIVWVMRTSGAPHAYMQNTGLLYPRRVGTEIVWLSEAEVAEAYRARFAGLQDRLTEAAGIENDFIAHLDPRQPFVVTTLVPDLPGSVPVTAESFEHFQTEILLTPMHIPGGAYGVFGAASVRYKRFVASGAEDFYKPVAWTGCELHESGAGVYASNVETPSESITAPSVTWIGDQVIVHGIASALRILARHARDRAGTGGLATLRATIYPGAQLPPLELVRFLDQSGPQRLVRQSIGAPPVSDTVGVIDDIAEDSPALLAATYRLASGLFQDFGHPEAEQLNREGAIRSPFWNEAYKAGLISWATAAGITVLDR